MRGAACFINLLSVNKSMTFLKVRLLCVPTTLLISCRHVIRASADHLVPPPPTPHPHSLQCPITGKYTHSFLPKPAISTSIYAEYMCNVTNMYSMYMTLFCNVIYT